MRFLMKQQMQCRGQVMAVLQANADCARRCALRKKVKGPQEAALLAAHDAALLAICISVYSSLCHQLWIARSRPHRRQFPLNLQKRTNFRIGMHEYGNADLVELRAVQWTSWYFSSIQPRTSPPDLIGSFTLPWSAGLIHARTTSNA